MTRSELGLVRVPAEDRKQVQTDINGTRYGQRDGYFYMRPDHAATHQVSANVPASPPAGPIGRRAGFRCTQCGFGTFFKTCGRCGAPCEREG